MEGRRTPFLSFNLEPTSLRMAHLSLSWCTLSLSTFTSPREGGGRPSASPALLKFPVSARDKTISEHFLIQQYVGADIIMKSYAKRYCVIYKTGASGVPDRGVLSLIVAGSTYNFSHIPTQEIACI